MNCRTPEVVAVWLILACGLAWGQDEDIPTIERPKLEAKNPLLITLEPVLLNARSGAPIPLHWNFKWTGKGILEGRLKYTLSDMGRPLGTFYLDDLALSGEQSFRTLLPAVRAPEDLDAVDVFFTFIGTERTFEPKPQTVKIPLVGLRHVTILLCDTTDVSLSPEAGNLIDALSVSQFEPDRRSLVTQHARYKPQEMPAHPLPLCAFDLVLVSGQAFQNLREPQIVALRQWVEAGGALYLSPGNGLQERHLKFLNELGREDFAETPFRRDPQGSLVTQAKHSGWLALRRGFGRAVVTFDLPIPKTDQRQTPERRTCEDIAAFLWRVSTKNLEMGAEGRQWPKTESPQQRHRSVYGGNSGQVVNQASVFHIRHAPIGEWVLTNLLPDRVQVVPLWLLAGLLAVYLALIGPVEFWGLGAIRMRRATWILFPITTFAFTGGIVWLSNRYMYSEVQSRSVSFRDVIDDGRVARETRLELLFTNAHRDMEYDIAHTLFTPLNLEAFGAKLKEKNIRKVEDEYFDPDDVDAFNPSRLQGSQAEKVEYSGRIPARYTARQPVPQWTPQFNRWTILAPEVKKVIFPWTAFTAEEFTTEDGRERLKRTIRDKFGGEVTAVLLAPRSFIKTEPPKPDAARNIVLIDEFQESTVQLLTAVSWTGGQGLFSRLGRLSPSGGSNLEDLAIVDTESDEWLLMIFVADGDNYIAYRRPYRERSKG